MKTKISLLVAISLFLFSCGNTSNEKSKEQTEIVTQEEHQQHQETKAIELNNGEKWKVNEEMMPYIRSMENDINVFSIAEQKDYKSFSEKLRMNIDLLISSCTMKGKAHDELHKWLLPYIQLVNELSETKDKTEAAKQFQNIQTSFTVFKQYFQ